MSAAPEPTPTQPRVTVERLEAARVLYEVYVDGQPIATLRVHREGEAGPGLDEDIIRDLADDLARDVQRHLRP